MRIKPYTKVVLKNSVAVAAIYEPHPLRNGTIAKMMGTTEKCTPISDDEWCWVYYDCCGNPIGTSNEQPDGRVVDKLTAEDCCGYQKLADYLNIE